MIRCSSFGANSISLIYSVHVLERGEKIESEQRERERVSEIYVVTGSCDC